MNVRTFSLRLYNQEHLHIYNFGVYAAQTARTIQKARAFEILDVKGNSIRLENFWGTVGGDVHFTVNNLDMRDIDFNSFVLGLLMAGCTIYTQE